MKANTTKKMAAGFIKKTAEKFLRWGPGRELFPKKSLPGGSVAFQLWCKKAIKRAMRF